MYKTSIIATVVLLGIIISVIGQEDYIDDYNTMNPYNHPTESTTDAPPSTRLRSRQIYLLDTQNLQFSILVCVVVAVTMSLVALIVCTYCPTKTIQKRGPFEEAELEDPEGLKAWRPKKPISQW